jgi:hypothetical protein
MLICVIQDVLAAVQAAVWTTLVQFAGLGEIIVSVAVPPAVVLAVKVAFMENVNELPRSLRAALSIYANVFWLIDRGRLPDPMPLMPATKHPFTVRDGKSILSAVICVPVIVKVTVTPSADWPVHVPAAAEITGAGDGDGDGEEGVEEPPQAAANSTTTNGQSFRLQRSPPNASQCG